MRADRNGATDTNAHTHQGGLTKSKRSWLSGPLRALASATLLWLLLRNVEAAAILRLLGRAVENWPLLLIAAIMPGIGVVIGAWRWKVLLETQGIRAPTIELCKANLVGTFYNQMLPSTIGGDVARIYWVSTVTATTRRDGLAAERRTLVNLTVVGVDRIVGMVGILATGLLAALLSPAIAQQVPGLWVILIIAGIGTIGVALLPHLPARSIGRRIFSVSLLARARDRAATIYRALKAYQGKRRPLFGAFLLSLCMQLNIIVEYWLLSAALGIGLSVWELAVLVPIVSMISMIPITINGIGLRENALNTLGVSFGLNPENAIALAWSFLALKIMLAAFGGLIQLVGPQRKSL